jgi:hypothetical protein
MPVYPEYVVLGHSLKGYASGLDKIIRQGYGLR